MKMKETIKPITLNDSMMDTSKIKGHVTITLKDVETGKEEKYENHNMLTNAMQEYFKNCGFLNYPNLDKNNMVQLLLGGVMGFDTPFSEDATIVHVPAGYKMIFNGSVGTAHSGQTPSEMGSYIPEDSGWQPDGSYVEVYEFQTGQANGTIASVCLTGQNYAYCGEGNSTSLVRHTTGTDITTLAGSVTGISGVTGYVFNIDFVDSSCYTFAIETRPDPEDAEQTYTTGVLRKYRLPISKLNIKGTLSAQILLSEEEIAIDSDLESADVLTQPLGNNLLIWNIQKIGTSVWGNGFTQYLWTLTPLGTLTKATVTNATGDSLYGLQAAKFDGDYCFFVDAYNTDNKHLWMNTTKIYVWDRTNNTMEGITNDYGYSHSSGYTDDTYWYNNYVLNLYGWYFRSGSGDGRIATSGNYPFVVDAVSVACYPNNASTASLGDLKPTSAPLIRTTGINLYRDQSYIATIFNLETPVVKTNTKMMRVVYRLTFNEEEEENS